MRSNEQNSDVLKKKEAERIEFGKFPNSTTLVIWKMNLKCEFCSSSSLSTEAMVWINEVVAELESLSSLLGPMLPDFEVLDSWNASALKKLLTAYFKRRVHMGEQKAQQVNRFLKGS